MAIHQRWTDLAELLLDQRVRVLGERSRADWCRKVEAPERIIFDLENARRENYGPATLVSLERWYGIPAERLADVLGDAWPAARHANHAAATESRMWTLITPDGVEIRVPVRATATFAEALTEIGRRAPHQ